MLSVTLLSSLNGEKHRMCSLSWGGASPIVEDVMVVVDNRLVMISVSPAERIGRLYE